MCRARLLLASARVVAVMSEQSKEGEGGASKLVGVAKALGVLDPEDKGTRPGIGQADPPPAGVDALQRQGRGSGTRFFSHWGCCNRAEDWSLTEVLC